MKKEEIREYILEMLEGADEGMLRIVYRLLIDLTGKK